MAPVSVCTPECSSRRLIASASNVSVAIKTHPCAGRLRGYVMTHVTLQRLLGLVHSNPWSARAGKTFPPNALSKRFT